jgi:hypothetical protein
MKITVLDEYLKLNFARCLIANELNGKLSLVYRFSDPDGIRTGKSGWSFGVCQFDINNNRNAALCLTEAGFSPLEIEKLQKQQFSDMTMMNEKLNAHREVVNRWDARQIRECLDTTLRYCNEIGTDFSCEETVLHIADFHNQLHFDHGGDLYKWLQANIANPITPEMIRDYKLSNTVWGHKDPEDVNRRYNNIRRICAEPK